MTTEQTGSFDTVRARKIILVGNPADTVFEEEDGTNVKGAPASFVGASVWGLKNDFANNGVQLLLRWATEIFDTDNVIDVDSATQTDQQRFVAPVAGYYNLLVQVKWANGATPAGHRQLTVQNQASTAIAHNRVLALANDHVQAVETGPVLLSAGDYLYASVFQDSGSGKTLDDTTQEECFARFWKVG